MRAPPRETVRLDKWLFHARLLRSRALASDLVAEGRVRVNGQQTSKPARAVGAGDVLTFALHGRVRVLRVLAAGSRRGPAAEAQGLYEDLAPRPSGPPGPPGPDGAGAGPADPDPPGPGTGHAPPSA